MALKIRPVRLNKSIYVRVPNDIADLIGIDGEAEITLRFQDADEQFFLIYSIRKPITVPLKLPEQMHVGQQ
ncbi:MAG: hypothetical protein ACLP5V_05230 [Candidatus Bathyarchaeia archaeon]